MAALVERLRIKCGSPAVPLGSLSGGNQQKVVAAKWLAHGADIYLFCDPTRGVDVGGKADIYRLVRELADRGSVVVITSSDLLELAELCDRVHVFHQHRLTGSIEREELSHSALLHAINTGVASPGTRPQVPDHPRPTSDDGAIHEESE